jgi:hypothetical protein
MGDSMSNYVNKLERQIKDNQELLDYQRTEISNLKAENFRLHEECNKTKIKNIEHKKQIHYIINKFIQARIRKDIGSNTETNFICKAFKNWNNPKSVDYIKVSEAEFRNTITSEFEFINDGQNIKDYRPFFSEEEVEEFDKEKAGEKV